MASPVIAPVAKCVYLCDGAIGYPGGKTDLMGLFNSITPRIYPHVFKGLVVFAQLKQGLGQVPFYVEITFPAAQQTIYVSNVKQLHFPNRGRTIQLAYTVPSCTFSQPGLYLVELFCNNQWVADTTLILQ